MRWRAQARDAATQKTFKALDLLRDVASRATALADRIGSPSRMSAAGMNLVSVSFIVRLQVV